VIAAPELDELIVSFCKERWQKVAMRRGVRVEAERSFPDFAATNPSYSLNPAACDYARAPRRFL